MTIFGLCFSGSVHGVQGRHDPALAALSFVVAVFAAYTALEIAERFRSAQGLARRLWRLAAAVALGGGIWSMHFVAMLAFKVPLLQAYDPVLTTASGLTAIAAVAVGLGVFERPVTAPRLALAGCLVGLGVAVMHYCGMSALRIPGQIYYRPGLFVASVAIAIAAATAALWLAYTLRSARHRGAAALVMAVAICGMHYTGMAAAVFVASPAALPAATAGVDGGVLAGAVSAILAVILCLALACAFVDRRFERQAAMANRLRDLNASLAARTESLTAALAEIDEARQRAEAADRAKSEFLANISHEIRTPLNGVLALSSLLARSDLDAGQREMVQIIESSAKTLNVLLTDVLDLAKIESGRLELEALPFSPADCIRQVQGLFAPAAAEKGLSFTADVEAALDAPVIGDPTRLTQILTNLCSNAIKFTGSGGVEIRAVAADDGAARSFIISVTDTGIGMTAEACGRVFERFVQADGSICRSFGGTGLGLAISRSLARLMGGDLAVRSEPGAGSTFTLTLALSRWSEPVPQAAAQAGPAARRPLRWASAPDQLPAVLVVEDHPINQRVVELILDGAAALECADNGCEGLAAFKARPFALVLMDTQMPVMDGLEATREIRALERAGGRARTPIIMLSANAHPDHVAQALAAGADQHLAKPVTADGLFEAVEQALDRAGETEALRVRA